ncbi:MAG: InlB B-repeat-containing protein [Clostridia bacterium]|nr:InlB B-repeat-containing protein [Clostridia bacterium]
MKEKRKETNKMNIQKLQYEAKETNITNESNPEQNYNKTTTKLVDRKKTLLAAIILLIMLIATGIYAYFTSTKTATNVFTIGSIDIVLTEGEVWDTASENGVAPESAQNIEPGQHITKAPNVENVGKNPAYVYLKVYVPVYDEHNLFSYTVNETSGQTGGWTLRENDVKHTTIDGQLYNIYVYEYDETLQPNTTTDQALFDEVVFAENIYFTPEQIAEMGTVKKIIVKAYAIQSESGVEKSNNDVTALALGDSNEEIGLVGQILVGNQLIDNNGTVQLLNGASNVQISFANNQGATYTSSETGVATVSNAGVINAVSTGTTTISIGGDGIKAKDFTLKVVDAITSATVKVAGNTVTTGTPVLIKSGTEKQIEIDNSDTVEDVEYSISPTTGNISVDSTGKITVANTAQGGETATITITGKLSGETRTISIEVAQPKIVFNSNGGTGTMEEQVLEEGVTTNIRTNSFTKSGFTFSNWNTEADGSGRSYNDKQQITDAITSGGTLTLYAQWYDSSLSKVKYAVQIYGINQDVDVNNQTLGLTFGPATGANYNNSYVTHEYEETSSGSEEYYVKIVTHTVAEDGSETVNETPEYLTDSSSNRVVRNLAEKEAYDINMHEMSWQEIEAVEPKTKFTDCMLCGDTKSVNLTLNSTIKSGTTQTAYGDGAGVLTRTINDYYKRWNPAKNNSTSAANNSAVGTGVTLDSYEQKFGSNARNAGAYRTSHIRATLIGSDVSNPTEDYAGDVNLDSTTCLYSCIESGLKDVITPKKVKYVTGSNYTSGNYNANNTPLVDSIWLFSEREVYGTGQYSGNTTEGLGTNGDGYSKFGNTESKYYMSTYNTSSTANRTAYNEAGSVNYWWLRSPYLVIAYYTYDVSGRGDVNYSAPCNPYALGVGFCIR